VANFGNVNGWLIRRESLVFLIVGLGLLIPIWAVHWIPTQDGPSHLYNARILSDLFWSDSSYYADYYGINLTFRSLPNWFSHVALASLMGIFPPLVAEKVLLSALAVL
jgi:hypothetical protein